MVATKNEIKAALFEAGVEFPAKANLATLQSLFDALPVAPTTPVEPEHFLAHLADGTPTNDCPACGIHLSNGLLMRDDEVANKPGVTLYMEGMVHQYNCMGCGADFGGVVEPYVAPVAATGLKIEKERPEQNGVKRPSIGGRCRAVWDALDEVMQDEGVAPTAAVVKALAAENGWNPNNASIEFYQWRKFNGITGRAPKVVDAPAPAATEEPASPSA